MNEWEEAGVVLHGWNNRSIQKLTQIFEDKYEEISEKSEDLDEDWICFLNSHDCTVVNMEDIIDDFAHLVNYDSRIGNSVCITDIHGLNSGVSSFIFIPKELAEKVLVLGDLP